MQRTLIIAHWVLASSLAGAAGSTVVWGLGRWLNEGPAGAAQIEGVLPVVALALFPLVGAIAGAIQWLVLRPALHVSRWWILLSALGVPAGLVVLAVVFGASVAFGGGETTLGLAVAAAAGGLLFGSLQGPLLARHGWIAWAWPVANAASWAAAIVAFLLVTRGGDAAWPGLSAGGALAGGLHGLVTGVVVLAMLPRTERHATAASK